MGITAFIIVLLIALFIGGIFFYGLKRRGPWGAFWVFLLVLFLASWAGRLWIAPAGPVFWGFGWLSVIFWVFIIALIIGLATPPERDRIVDYEPDTKTEITESDRGTAVVFGFFFWILMLVFIIAIIGGLLR